MFVTRAVLDPNVTTFRDSLYLGAADYEYRVVSFFEISSSDPSNTVSFTTQNAVDAVIHWAYEEASGTITQDNGFLNRDGDLLNGLNFDNVSVAGLLGSGLVLDGRQHLVRYRIGNIINEKQDYPFSISTWVKTTSTDNETVVYFGATALTNYFFRLRISSGNAVLGVRRLGDSEDVVAGPQVSDGQWH